MNSFMAIGIFLSCLVSSHSQYSNEEEQYPKRPPPQILTHKQALNHDGNFKYLFTSDNGLAQGESIAPDGTRSGGYSYIDPNGKKISVKYVAGKEGFKILEADHLPKAPQPIAPLPQPHQQQPHHHSHQPYNQPQRNEEDEGYRNENYENARPAISYYQPKAYIQPQAYSQPKLAYPEIHARSSAPISNAISNEKEAEYNDEPGKAGSFGSGYIFEFGSG